MSRKGFDSCLKNGKKTEALIGEFLVNRGFEVEDKSDDEYYRKIDVDFVLHKIHDYKLEVKSDSRISKTGNVFIEDCMYRQTGKRNGWLHYCDADVLCYYDEINKVAYMLKWKEIKKIVSDFRRVEFWNSTDKCKSAGYLIPIDYILSHDLCLHEYDL